MDNEKTYQGKPCKHGHSGIRWKANKTCVECQRKFNRNFHYQRPKETFEEWWAREEKRRAKWQEKMKLGRNKPNHPPLTTQT